MTTITCPLCQHIIVIPIDTVKPLTAVECEWKEIKEQSDE